MYLKSLFCWSIFAFPIVAATVRHGASTVFCLLAGLGLFVAWPAWRELHDFEKKLIKGFIIFFALMAVSLLYSENLKAGGMKLERYIRFLFSPLIYLAIRRFRICSGKHLFYGLIAAGFVVFFQAIFQYQSGVGEGFRASGAYEPILFGDTAMFIAVILLCGVLALALEPRQYALGSLAALAALFASFLSGTRGALLALPLIGIALLWLYRRSLSRKSVAFILAGLAAGGCLAWLVVPESSRERARIAVRDIRNVFTSPDQEMDTARTRLLLWRDSLVMFRNAPLQGTGIGDFEIDFERLKKQGLTNNPLEGIDHAHNIYLDSLVRTGLIGTTAMIYALFVLPLDLLRRYWSPARRSWAQFYCLAGMMTLLLFAAFGLSEAWLSRMAMTTTFILSLVVFLTSTINENLVTGPEPVQLQDDGASAPEVA